MDGAAATCMNSIPDTLPNIFLGVIRYSITERRIALI
jgi:hypothetical protein